MNAINTNDTKTDNSIRKGRFLNVLKKILLYTVAAIVVALVLVALYQILKYMFVAAVLVIAWLCPKRWWW